MAKEVEGEKHTEDMPTKKEITPSCVTDVLCTNNLEIDFAKSRNLTLSKKAGYSQQNKGDHP